MFTYLYQMIISPLVTILEVFYLLFDKITDNSGISIIGLSFVVTLLTLPLYMIAEKWQNHERCIQNKLKPGVDRIKQSFKGDEQYMILSTFYKQNHYHPIMALRSSFSLLIQIPFFIAAYNYLSNLTTLRGDSFLFIKDFGAPDSLFSIGNFSINILPILMTIINCISGIIYSKNHPVSEKIQIFACAAVFLILLYNSPAALVLYWTMNNILSLVKNIFYKLKNPKKTLYIILCIISFSFIFISIFILKDTKLIFRLCPLVLGIIMPFLPFIFIWFYRVINNNFKIIDDKSKLSLSIFIISSLILVFLAGLYIPSTLIQSEPEQFCYVDKYNSPFNFLFTTFFQATGFFLFWPACFYFLFSKKIKKIFTVLFPILAISAVINSIAFSGNYGPLQQDLIFMIPQRFFPSKIDFLINTLCLVIIILVCTILMSKTPKLLNNLCFITFVSLFALGFINSVSIQKSYKKMPAPSLNTKPESIYHLSKTGKNVIVIMQDRLFIPYVQEALTSNLKIKNSYKGFTLFNNTVSFGPYTMLGTPGLFGGYDFTPYEINKRENETLQQKHNQALLTMPTLFLNENWNVTVSDLPYENYLEYPVTKMYEDYPDVNRINTVGTYSDLWYKRHNMTKEPYFSFMIKRNLIWFSLFKIVPPVLRTGVYGRDYWISYNKYENNNLLIDNYSTLEFLPELCDFNSNKNSFIMIDNELTHDGALLQAPDYVPSNNVTEYEDGIYSHNSDYHTSMAALLRLSEFFEYLKKNDAYDNTRIIIVSDHGIPNNLESFIPNSNNLPYSPARKTATLLVKDFNSNSDISIEDTFMTNADTPYLATKDIINNAKNPFTNNPLKIENKQDYIKISIANAESTRIRNNSKFKISENEWITVKDNIYDINNWSFYEEK